MIEAAIFVCGVVAYPGRVERIVDGDTAEVEVHLGLGVEVQENARLWGIDAPERRQEEGPAATAHLAKIMPVGSRVYVELMDGGRDKFGRMLARFYNEDCTDLNQRMVDDGHAIERWRD